MPGHPIRPVRASATPDRLSRANDVHARTLEVLDQHGLAGAALAAGLQVRRSIIVVDRQPVVDIPLDDLDSPFPRPTWASGSATSNG